MIDHCLKAILAFVGEHYTRALHGFLDSLRLEVGKHNIDITIIAPGKVITNFGKNKLDSKGNPFGRNSLMPFGLSSKKAASGILSPCA